MRETDSLNGHVHEDLLAFAYEPGSCCARTELLTLLSALGASRRSETIRARTNDVLLARRLLRLCREVLGRSHPVRLHQEPSSATPGRHRLDLFVAPFDGFHDAGAALAEARARAADRPCCALAFMRALYWKGGYLPSPHRGFHLELVLPRPWPRDGADEAIATLGLALRRTERRGRVMLYAKAADVIVDVLARMGATMTVLLLQDISITKELKNDVNRGVNCEVGNLRRSSVSSAADIEAVRFLKKHDLLDRLPERLRTVADVRCRFPSLSLTELGRRLDPPLTKAGVFHRLRQLRKEAEVERKRTQ